MSSPPMKRRRLGPTRDISPPLQRKRKTEDTPKSAKQQDLYETAPTAKVTQRGLNEIFSVMSWNVNGISHLLPNTQKSIQAFFSRHSPQGEGYSDNESCPTTGSPLRQFLKRHNWPQVLCLQEVKIAPTDSTAKTAVEKAANGSEGPSYKAHFSLPRDKHNARGWGGKVYGVCTLLRSDIPVASTTREVDWDLEGRVLITTFEGWKLVVVNGYWVNGTTNPYRDSRTGVVVGTRHDRKRHFHSLMLEEVKGLEAEGYGVLLIGDMNIARSPHDGYPGIRLVKEHVTNRRDFNAKFFDDEDGMKGVDTWRHVHGEMRGYTYHGESAEEWGRNCDRVDLGILSRAFVERGALVGAEIWESVEERGGSDHVPLEVVLDIGVLGKDTRTTIS